MALTNATTLADYGAGIGTQGTTLKVDANNKRVGIGTTNPQGPEGSLQVGTGITFFGNTGIVSAIGGKFSGDFTVGGTLTYEDVANIDAVGIITAQSGVSIADSIFHTGDTNTAIRFPAADTFTIETAGVERGRFTSSNQFVLGPRGSARTNFDNGTVSSNLLHIERQGTGSNTGASFLSNTPHADSGAVLYMAKSRSTDNSSATIVSNGDQLGRISFQGADGSNYVEAASIRGHVDGTPGSDDMPGRLSFRTTSDGGTSSTERLRITSAGLVGIGSATPTGKLEVAHDSQTDLLKLKRTSGNIGTFTISLGGATPGTIFSTSGTCDDFVFISGSERLRITSAGLVGIGTDNPGGTLHVHGAVGGAGQIYVTDGDAAGTGNSFLISKGGTTTTLKDRQASSNLDFGTADTTAMRIDSSQRLLIGSTSARANTFNASAAPQVQVEGTNANLASIGIFCSASDVDGGRLLLAHQRSGGIGGNTIVNDDDLTGSITFQGSDGTQFVESAAIKAEIDNSPAANDMPGRLVFMTTSDGAASASERLRITSTGRVGININNPDSYNSSGNNLVLGDTGNNAGLTIVSSTTNNGHIFFADGGGSGAGNRGIIKYEHGNDAMAFNTAENERLRIDSTGRVFIDTQADRPIEMPFGNTLNSAQPGKLVIEDSGAGNLNLIIARENQSNAYGPAISLVKSRGTSDGSYTVVQSGDNLGTIQFGGADGSADRVGAAIVAQVDTTPGSDDMPGRLMFATTADGSGHPVERLRITSEGELLVSNSGNRFLSLDRTNASSGSGEFNVNVESDSQASISYDDGAPLVIGTSSSPRTQAGFTERLRIDENGNLKLADSTLGIPASGSPPETFFVGRKAAIRSVTVTTTLNGSGEGTFDLGRIHYNDDESFEIFMSICINNNTTLRTSYCKAFCQKVRGTGLTDFVIDRQDSAHSGFSVSSLSSGTAQGVSGHGLNVNVTGGTASTEYRITALIHSVSKNDLY